LRRYQEGTHGANTFQIKKDVPRSFHNSLQNWLYVNPDTNAVINLDTQSGTINYVMVRIREVNDDLQSRAFWDTDIGLTGEEFFDEVNVRLRFEEEFLVSQTGFEDPALGWIPLFVVVVDPSGVVISADRADSLLWQPRNLSLPQARETVYESSVQDLRTFIDFLGSIVSEVKGQGATIESIPWTSIKLLKEYQNLFVTGGGDVSFEVAGSNVLRFSNQIGIGIAGRSQTYTLGNANANNDYILTDGQCLYVKIPETGATTALTPQISLLKDVPLNPLATGHQNTILVLFYRKGNTIYGSMDIPDISTGETANVGQDLPKNIRTRLGILAENSYKAYASLVNISPNDDYPDALSKLDSAIAQIQNNLPQEEVFLITQSNISSLSLSQISFIANHTIADIVVYQNGVKLEQSLTGDLDKGFRKNGTAIIDFPANLPLNTKITVRKERTGGSGGSGGSTDLTNIFVSPQPAADGGHALGSSIKGWDALFLKDRTTGTKIALFVDNGVLTLEEQA
ncbi:MAG: hypothetical protein ACXVCY_04665, partial [Pseudobdellovibrionaceae bacterium]